MLFIKPQGVLVKAPYAQFQAVRVLVEGPGAGLPKHIGGDAQTAVFGQRKQVFVFIFSITPNFFFSFPQNML